MGAGHKAIEALMDRTLKEDVKLTFRLRVVPPSVFISSRLQTLNGRQSLTFLSFFWELPEGPLEHVLFGMLFFFPCFGRCRWHSDDAFFGASLVIFVEAKNCCIEAEVCDCFWKVAIARTGLFKFTEDLSRFTGFKSAIFFQLLVLRES